MTFSVWISGSNFTQPAEPWGPKMKLTKLKRTIKQFLDRLPIPDEWYVRLLYFVKLGKPLHLKHPKTLNEKILWINLKGNIEKYSHLADKYKVRGYVADTAGSQYLVDLYGVYDSPAEINFDELPEQFVLKTNHGSRTNIICKDKGGLDISKARASLDKWMKKDFYKPYRERIYRNIERKIICEQFLEGADGKEPHDYKFFCFHGKVLFLKIDLDRFSSHKRYFFDRNWVNLPSKYYRDSGKDFPKPDNFMDMIDVAEKLAGDIPFVRVDVYNVDRKIYFGEMTFTPTAGFGQIRPEGWDCALGMYLHLPV